MQSDILSKATEMTMSLSHRLAKEVPTATALYHRLILVAGPPRTGKTTALRELAERHSWPLVNVNLSLSERLLEIDIQGSGRSSYPRLLDQIATEHNGDVVILDNTEVLFSPEFQQDPLRLLHGLSRNRTVIAAWAGDQVGENLPYAEPAHPEFRRYHKPDAIIVSTNDA